MAYMMLDLTLMTAASKAEVTILRLESLASAAETRGFLPEGELADSAKLPCFSTLMAAIGFMVPVGELTSDSLLERALLLCMLKALILELKFGSRSDGVYRCC